MSPAAMEATLVSSDNGCEIRMSGRFDYHGQAAFMLAAERAITSDNHAGIRLDLAHIDYIDSTGLGLLLIARDRARRAGKKISLANARSTVRQALDIAQFGRLFEME